MNWFDFDDFVWRLILQLEFWPTLIFSTSQVAHDMCALQKYGSYVWSSASFWVLIVGI